MRRPSLAQVGSGPFRALTSIAAVAGVLFPFGVKAAVREVALTDLAKRSELIVVARVVKVENGLAQLESSDPSMPALKVAIAQVIENWKGKSIREVRYIASPTHYYDIATAEVGEQVVLFLEKGADSGIRNISHVGRGRMQLRVVGTKMDAVLAQEIILPNGTPTLTETKKSQITLPPSEPGKPALSIAFTYTVESIELDVLRRLVKSAGR
jgi:hypothetical protein